MNLLESYGYFPTVIEVKEVVACNTIELQWM